MEDFDGLFDGDILRNNDHATCLHMSQMQRRELGRAQSHLALHEVLLQNIALRFERLGKIHAHHTSRQSIGLGLDQHIVHEHKSCTAFLEDLP